MMPWNGCSRSRGTGAQHPWNAHADALRPAAESALREWPVSRRVNRAGVGEDDPTIIERVEAA
jgi:hypothetical protein